QKIWAQAGFRPVDPGVAEQFTAEFPVPQKLWTIADLGGWSTVDPALFDKDNGAISGIYKKATG
ncbi:MAG: sulfate ABC transporter substrate-binding protein, partial [Mycobacterium sp.]|nr:sulfate ABC transporter substrate-binding protein [Mycobacterium sp.]